jgi:RNA polymerase sigma-70 factor (ECF subfamily)
LSESEPRSPTEQRARPEGTPGSSTLGEQFAPVLEAAREGTEWALVRLYRTFHPKLLRYLQAQEPVEAEDLASEVWLEAARGLRRFEGDESAFQGWIFVIARRRLIDFRRRADRRRSQPVAIDSLSRLKDFSEPDSEAIEIVSTEAALEMIGRLPPDQADVLLLRIITGLDVAEVARILGKRPGTVRVLQHRALKRLLKELSDEV